MAVAANDIITHALTEIGAYSPGESMNADEAAAGLSKLNRMMDLWQTRRLFIYSMGFTNYTLTPNLSPHTIGPSGTFNVTSRPVEIKAAAIILNNVTPNVTNPLNLRDDDWWANQRIKSLATSLPTDLYYSPDVPLGQLFFWPVPNTAYGVELETRVLLTNFADLVTTYNLAPGYEEAITMSLAEGLIPMFGVQSQMAAVSVASAAMRARAAIQGTNASSPQISTKDYGMPDKGSSNRSNFNYRTGLLTR